MTNNPYKYALEGKLTGADIKLLSLLVLTQSVYTFIQHAIMPFDWDSSYISELAWYF